MRYTSSQPQARTGLTGRSLTVQQFVTYRRVSTREQGTSGLGLEAQASEIERFLAALPGPWEIIGAFEDIQSGADDDRPELGKALDLVKKHRATLLVSKLDRLSRRVAFIAEKIADPRVDLRVASLPNADRFQLHLFAALAEAERDLISTRTKAALAAAKARGQALGGRREGAVAASTARKEQARAREAEAATLAHQLRTEGTPLRRIAQALHDAGMTPANGGSWSATQVQRMLDRREAA